MSEFNPKSLRKIEEIKNKMQEEEETSTNNTLAGQLVNLVLDSDLLLFHDQLKEPYAAIYGDGREIMKIDMKIDSKDFRRWLSRLAWGKMHKAINSEAMQNVLQILQSKALFDGNPYELHVRVASYDGAVWYDLGDGKAVKMGINGRRILFQTATFLFLIEYFIRS